MPALSGLCVPGQAAVLPAHSELLRHSPHWALSQCSEMCSVSLCSEETCALKGKITEREITELGEQGVNLQQELWVSVWKAWSDLISAASGCALLLVPTHREHKPQRAGLSQLVSLPGELEECLARQ